MKVALVYDRINKWGGAERLLLAIHQLFPNAPIYTSVYNPKKAAWARVFTVQTSFLQNFPYASSMHESYAALMPLAFESFSFDSYDLVISITSEAAKGIITKPHTKHICICLTPTRYLWSGYDEYFRTKSFRLFTKPIVSYLRRWDLVAASRPDHYIAISKEVQKRIKKYYNRESEVVYPPVSLVNRGQKLELSKNKETNLQALSSNNYYLVVSRLVPYKRIDLAIQACNRRSLPLVIVGTGSQAQKLKNLAGPTITFTENLTDKELVEYYKGCKALLFPGKEDFGLTVLEAQSFGKPVIAFKGGGALETIIEGKTGIFFSSQTVELLVDALQRFQTMTFDANKCMHQANTFSEWRFKNQFVNAIKKTMKQFNNSTIAHL